MRRFSLYLQYPFPNFLFAFINKDAGDSEKSLNSERTAKSRGNLPEQVGYSLTSHILLSCYVVQFPRTSICDFIIRKNNCFYCFVVMICMEKQGVRPVADAGKTAPSGILFFSGEES